MITDANVKSDIILEDYNDNRYFKLNLLTYKATEIYDVDNIQINGFISFEKCGLFHKKDYIFIVYKQNSKCFLIIDDLKVSLDDIKFIKYSNFLPFIQRLQIIRKNNTIFSCQRWSKNIDEFIMDDFLYYLNFIYKNKDINLCNLFPHLASTNMKQTTTSSKR